MVALHVHCIVHLVIAWWGRVELHNAHCHIPYIQEVLKSVGAPNVIQWRNHNSILLAIIESVDSNVGIARTRNIWPYIKISPNLKNGELISLYDNILFIFECFHDQPDSQWHEKASWKYPTKQQQNGQIVFLLLLLLSFFRRASSVLRQPLALVYARNSNILYWTVHDPIVSSQLRSLARRS